MAKVRFYVDVPEYRFSGHSLVAYMQPMVKPYMPGMKRVAFDVELPPEVWKAFDEPAQASNAHVTITEDDDDQY